MAEGEMTAHPGLEERARAVMPAAAYEFYAAGADEEITRWEAEGAWRSWRLLPHVLRAAAAPDTGTALLSGRLALPVLVAPAPLHALAYPQGEVAAAAGAAAAGSFFVLCDGSAAECERVDAAAAGPWWFETHLLADRAESAGRAARAAAAGAQAIVLSVGAPEAPFTPPPFTAAGPAAADPRAPRRGSDPAAGPADIGRLHDATGLPVLVKGVLRPDDARQCVDAGAAGVIVSNHGGRRLDRALPTAYALRAVADAVGGSVPVLVDGGIRTGTDVLIALALGARAVLIGRPAVWALALGGAYGLARLLDSYHGQLSAAMTLTGAGDLAALTPDLLAPQPARP